jgi:hypothetical protein
MVVDGRIIICEIQHFVQVSNISNENVEMQGLRLVLLFVGFALSQADRSVVCLIFIFAMILTSLIFGKTIEK